MKKYPPLNPLAVQIRDILYENQDSPREGIVTGQTVAAVKIEEMLIEKLKLAILSSSWTENDLCELNTVEDTKNNFMEINSRILIEKFIK